MAEFSLTMAGVTCRAWIAAMLLCACGTISERPDSGSPHDAGGQADAGGEGGGEAGGEGGGDAGGEGGGDAGGEGGGDAGGEGGGDAGGEGGGDAGGDGGGQADAGVSVPLPGFGIITGECGVLTEAELTSLSPSFFTGHLDFADDRYDDPDERPLLTDGGQIIVSSPNAGGSSVFSETFAFEVLARCELAELLKTENDLIYDPPTSKKADILVSIGGRNVGVSVVRAVTFPFGNPYMLNNAVNIISGKVSDIEIARANIVGDSWEKSVVVAMAYDEQHAQVLHQAWESLDAGVRSNVAVLTWISDGDDLFIYSNQ